ncbi:MAG: N-acetyl-alpha-D-glucosaminyl L-malate synthase BshA [Bacteroidetes bacterium]|jgi:N-acetyl-alpha-D-glucosaminyl L-malate synthase BshA|nr:N-acetyl-alpha-D-glucosaminyl L-malate synthase BshA [Bacteroidota bacterium]
MDKKLSIGIVCYPTFGGSGVVATELGMALAAKGHNIHFISYRHPERLSGQFQANISVHEVRPQHYPLFEFPPYELTLIGKILEVARFEKLDVLHVHYAIPHAFSGYNARQILASEGISLPVITTLHGTDVTLVGKDRSVAPVVKYSMEQSDYLTAVSHFLKEETYSYFNISKEIHVIHNFIDFGKFSKKEFGHFKTSIAPNGEKLLVHVSNFRKVKRVQDVIRSFEIVSKALPSKLLLVGDGPERSKMESLCRELKLCDQIRFIGKLSAVEDILSISDLFLLPSETESFGLAALEAMACECPVISTNIGGLPEINIHGVTGYLTDVGDVEAMAKHAIDLLKNPVLHAEFRKNAYGRAQEFSLDKILPFYEALYIKAVQEVAV